LPKSGPPPIPQPALSLAFDRTGEAGRVGDLVGLLMAHADELGDLDDADGGLQHLIHSR
jgi:hypothetical protein